MKKTNIKQTNMKKGITLIEIILAIVLIAIILGVTIPKLMTNSAKAEIKTVITSDIKSILETAATWRKSSAVALGSYQNLTTQRLQSRLPSNMEVDPTDGYILSSGLRTGNLSGNGILIQTGAQYGVAWDFDTPTNPLPATNTFTLIVDLTRGATDLNWNAKIQTYAQDVATDTMMEATNSTALGNAGIITLANGAGGAGTAVDCSVTDILCFINVQVR